MGIGEIRAGNQAAALYWLEQITANLSHQSQQPDSPDHAQALKQLTQLSALISAQSAHDDIEK